MKETLKEIWAYRSMIRSLVHKDLRGRYQASVLGFLWTFIVPLCQLLVYSVVFGSILQNEIEKFELYLFVALIPWNFFSACLTGGQQHHPAAEPGEQDLFPPGSGADLLCDKFFCEHAVL